MAWFSRKPPAEKKAVLGSALPRDDDRAGPAPPPPPSATPPGVSVFGFGDPCSKCIRVGETTGEFFLEGKKGKRGAGAMLLLRGRLDGAGATPSAMASDVLLGDAASFVTLRNPDASPTHILFEEISGSVPLSFRHIRRDDLGGRGVSGITGIRTLARIPGLSIVRLGPPPGARWALVGLRSFAVFAGRITAIDGGEPHDVNAGELATIADPTATLYLQAGNDSALGIGFAEPDLIVALG